MNGNHMWFYVFN